MAKVGMVSRGWGALGALGRRVSSVVRDERATAFGRKARQRFRELKRRLGLFDEDAFEDEEEQRRRRRARQMIGLHQERDPDSLDASAARLVEDEGEMESQVTRERISSATFSAGAAQAADDEEAG